MKLNEWTGFIYINKCIYLNTFAIQLAHRCLDNHIHRLINFVLVLCRSTTFSGLNEFTEYNITVRGVYSITSDSDVLSFGLNTTTTARTAEDCKLLMILHSN